MRLKLFPCIVGLCGLVSGCGPALNATRTLVIEPLQYCDSADKVIEWTRDEKLAKEAWEKVGHANGQVYSKDYERGFKFGFADYLYAGGKGLPPPLPPRRYWKPKYESPAGYQAIEEWYAGYAHGAALAMASGARQFVPVPSSVPPHVGAAPAAQPPPGPKPDRDARAKPPEMLPPPKPEPAAPAKGDPPAKPDAAVPAPADTPEAPRP
jgi:hypothetical protein